MVPQNFYIQNVTFPLPYMNQFKLNLKQQAEQRGAIVRDVSGSIQIVWSM